MPFLQDLQDGQQIEKEFSAYLKSNLGYIYTANIEGKCKDADIVAKKPYMKWESFEIKNDKKFSITKNVCVEMQCSDKASGVMRTTSDYIVYRLGEEWYQCKSATLRQWLWGNSNEYRVVKGGDKWKAELALVPIEKFKSIFDKI